jgi:uncharacterized protein
MSRPCKVRRVNCGFHATSFKPCGAPKHPREKVALTLDELEAMRLADLEGLYQEQAAKKMKISRQTFGIIIASARKKSADFLINSKRLIIGGGNVEINKCEFVCGSCRHRWSVTRTTERPRECPHCNSADINCRKRIESGHHFNKCRRSL